MVATHIDVYTGFRTDGALIKTASRAAEIYGRILSIVQSQLVAMGRWVRSFERVQLALDCL